MKKKHESETGNSSTQKLCISFLGCFTGSRLKMSLSKIGTMIHVKALFHRLVCRNFQWMSQLLNQRNFLEKEKVLSGVKAWSWNGENLCFKQFQTTSGNHQKSFSCVTLALNLATISQFFISWDSLGNLLQITYFEVLFHTWKVSVPTVRITIIFIGRVIFCSSDPKR